MQRTENPLCGSTSCAAARRRAAHQMTVWWKIYLKILALIFCLAVVLCDDYLCVALTNIVKAFHSQVKEILPEVATKDCYGFGPGEFTHTDTYSPRIGEVHTTTTTTTTQQSSEKVKQQRYTPHTARGLAATGTPRWIPK